MSDLKGKRALVTGGSRGIGAGIAEALAKAGADVAVTYEKSAGLAEEVVARIERLGGRGFAIQADSADATAVKRSVDEAAEKLGGLDILVNNAGIEITNLITEISAEEIRRQLDVNILGTALGIKHGLRAMRPDGPAGQGGSIINVSSVAATIAFPGIAIYSATKAAVDRLTRVSAMEAGKLGYGVRVNVIYPGLVPTAMGAGLAQDVASIGLFESPDQAVAAVIEQTPAGRLGEVEDMADAVVFLASDASRFITGAGLPVDGGMGM